MPQRLAHARSLGCTIDIAVSADAGQVVGLQHMHHREQ